MERIALQDLIKRNQNERKKTLIVWGARQVGKTYLVKEIFSKAYYKKITYKVTFYIIYEKNDIISNIIFVINSKYLD